MNQGIISSTSTEKRQHGLDHLRALAILLVFIFHYRMFGHPEWIDSLGKFGWTGVDLFFVLSGYLIATQLFQQISVHQTIPLRVFYIKRFFRILPPYLVVLLIYFAFPYVHEREALAPLWKYLTFTQNIGLDLRTQGTFSHAWSLCIEEQFYLLLPLILLGLIYIRRNINRVWLIVALFIAGFLIRLNCYESLDQGNVNFGIEWYKRIYYITYCRLDGLLIGISIAAFLHFRPKHANRILRYGNKLIILSLVVLASAYWLCMDEQSFGASVFGFPLVSLGYGILVFGALSPYSALYRYRSGISFRIATYSYAIYLIHKFIIHCIQDQLSQRSIEKEGIPMLLFCILGVWLGAWLMNNGVEKPAHHLRLYVLKKWYKKSATQMKKETTTIARIH